ncbi:flagellin [Rhizobium sp. LjRoot98]|uniref:flagellin N-terminal helical domain-containing protein n=1 Tax=unclassified Rhizobium TaxID=2613769 RepID=UPI000715F58B|nr:MULTISPECIES: flagellin [unclassified Rhizobium]KQV29091.1 flagellin [Rhizobium sp. Root1204]KQY03586.1 flagellin [Rhizobium sp. Root1334]KRC00229.1 flagellin [Rhizobium sp. Root73]
MTSILTNTAAMAALQTLRGIGSRLAETQSQISSGLSVQTAADNAAYWSISTTMRSDNMAISTVADAIGLGAAKVDTTYTGLDAAKDVLSEFRAKLVAAKEPGVDKAKIQKELEQFKEQFVSIATSASFNGVNWLKTDAPQNLWDLSSLPTNIVSAFTRSADGTVHVGTTEVDTADISLFNAGGGAALQKDIRALGNIGGFRPTDIDAAGGAGYQQYGFSGPFTWDAADTISFDVLVDDSPLAAGTSYPITINRAAVDAALGTTDGLVSTAQAYAAVLQHVLAAGGVPATAQWAGGSAFSIRSNETTGHPGSSIAVSGVTSSVAPGNFGAGLELPPVAEQANMYPQWSFSFSGPVSVHRDVEFSFDIQVGSDPAITLTITRDKVDLALGTSDGKITSAADMATLLGLELAGRGLNVSSTGTAVTFDIDKTLYPNAGTRSFMSIGNVADNIGPVPDFDILDVDITDPANDLDNYLTGVDIMLQKVISGASTLGAVKTRVDMQESFVQTLMDTIDKGIGRLVDADMDEASTRLKALQTQQQLGIQALQIANVNAENVLQLFQ